MIDKINLQPTEPTLDARHLDELFALWLSELAAKLDDATHSGYTFKVSYFRRWWQDTGPLHDWVLTRRLCIQFETELRTTISQYGKTLGYRTRLAIIHRLRQCLRWAMLNGYTSQNYGPWFPTPEGTDTRRTALTVEQLQALMNAAGTVRVRALFALMLGSGMRRGEASTLLAENVQFYPDGTGRATVTGKRTKANRAGVRDLALDAATVSYLKAHMRDQAYGPVFRTRTGQMIATPEAGRLLKKAKEAAGLVGKMEGCHDLRRAFAHYYAITNQSPAAGDMLRRQLGHTEYRQTSEYTLMGVEDLRQHIEGPLAQFTGQAEEH